AGAVVRLASAIERDWLEPNASEITHRFDASTGRVKADAIERYDALVLSERPMPVDAEVAAEILAAAWMERGLRPDDQQVLRRLRFAGGEVDVARLIRTAALAARALDELTLASAIGPAALRDLDRDAPQILAVPSGRHVRLEYHEDGTVSAAVKLQELFGL